MHKAPPQDDNGWGEAHLPKGLLTVQRAPGSPLLRVFTCTWMRTDSQCCSCPRDPHISVSNPSMLSTKLVLGRLISSFCQSLTWGEQIFVCVSLSRKRHSRLLALHLLTCLGTRHCYTLIIFFLLGDKVIESLMGLSALVFMVLQMRS